MCGRRTNSAISPGGNDQINAFLAPQPSQRWQTIKRLDTDNLPDRDALLAQKERGRLERKLFLIDMRAGKHQSLAQMDRMGFHNLPLVGTKHESSAL